MNDQIGMWLAHEVTAVLCLAMMWVIAFRPISTENNVTMFYLLVAAAVLHRRSRKYDA